MNKNSSFSILVNSSDNFEDCWLPFFTMYSKNLGGVNYPIFLNTEFKTYSYDNLQIHATQVHCETKDRKLTWSECFIKALQQIETDLVLYFQEDYFLEKPVDINFIELQASRMLNDSSIKRIGLTVMDHKGDLILTEFPELCEASNTVKYKISTQVALWRKDALLSYLSPKENGWMFEILGTMRSKTRQGERFLTLNRAIYDESNQIISYVHTGIIKGQWHPNMPKIFAANGIKNIDFSKRGFYDMNKSKLRSRVEVLQKLLKQPLLLFRAIFNI